MHNLAYANNTTVYCPSPDTPMANRQNTVWIAPSLTHVRYGCPRHWTLSRDLGAMCPPRKIYSPSNSRHCTDFIIAYYRSGDKFTQPLPSLAPLDRRMSAAKQNAQPSLKKHKLNRTTAMHERGTRVQPYTRYHVPTHRPLLTAYKALPAG